MSFSDWTQVFTLLLDGPVGWVIMGASYLATTGVGYWSAKRVYRTRLCTYALLGGDGKFAAHDDKDVDELFRAVDRLDQRLGDISNDTVKAARLAEKIIEECHELFCLNIAFRTQADRLAYLDRVKERADRAERVLQMARRSVKQVA
jgi:hypothetical protein